MHAAQIVQTPHVEAQAPTEGPVEALIAAYPAGTLLGDLLAGVPVTMAGSSLLMRCAVDSRTVLVVLAQTRPIALTEDAASDLLRANASLVAGVAACWSVDPGSGGLVLTCSIGTRLLAGAADGFGCWVKAIARCFVDSCRLMTAVHVPGSRAQEIAARALPIAEFRAEVASECEGSSQWAGADDGTACRGVGALRRSPRLRSDRAGIRWMIDDTFELSVCTHRWGGGTEVEVRLIDTGPDAVASDAMLDALQGVDELPTGVSVVGALIEGERLVRCWRFSGADDPLSDADALVAAILERRG